MLHSFAKEFQEKLVDTLYKLGALIALLGSAVVALIFNWERAHQSLIFGAGVVVTIALFGLPIRRTLRRPSRVLVMGPSEFGLAAFALAAAPLVVTLYFTGQITDAMRSHLDITTKQFQLVGEVAAASAGNSDADHARLREMGEGLRQLRSNDPKPPDPFRRVETMMFCAFVFAELVLPCVLITTNVTALLRMRRNPEGDSTQ
jgi:hypothetical protein